MEICDDCYEVKGALVEQWKVILGGIYRCQIMKMKKC